MGRKKKTQNSFLLKDTNKKFCFRSFFPFIFFFSRKKGQKKIQSTQKKSVADFIVKKKIFYFLCFEILKFEQFKKRKKLYCKILFEINKKREMKVKCHSKKNQKNQKI